MSDYEIRSFADFQSAIEKHDGEKVIYRGVRSACYGLMPKLGRCGIKPDDIAKQEQIIFNLFKERAVPYL
jgi:hypothetical protein